MPENDVQCEPAKSEPAESEPLKTTPLSGDETKKETKSATKSARATRKIAVNFGVKKWKFFDKYLILSTVHSWSLTCSEQFDRYLLKYSAQVDPFRIENMIWFDWIIKSWFIIQAIFSFVVLFHSSLSHQVAEERMKIYLWCFCNVFIINTAGAENYEFTLISKIYLRNSQKLIKFV